MMSHDVGGIGHGGAAYDRKPRQTLFGYIPKAARNAHDPHHRRADGLSKSVDNGGLTAP